MISGHAKMSVEFKRLPEKHRRASQYDVLVEDITIGRILKGCEEGWIIEPGTVEGTCKSFYAWYFEPVDSLDEYLDLSGNWRRLWCVPSEGYWRQQKQAFKAFERAMDAPLKRANKYDKPRVTIFLKWLRFADSERRQQRFSKNSAL